MRLDRSDLPAMLLRLLVAVGLVIDAVVHLRLAANYQLAQPSGIGQGNLFRVEAAAALLAAGYVLLAGSRRSFVVAAVVAVGGFVAVVLYRYVDVPALGPIPTMYEPVWFFQKGLSAVAEALAGLLALVGVLRVGRTPHRSKGDNAGGRV
ncbi:MAG: hypothetical protein M3Y66_06505 [Actinomycetota bacterium]|nr:hypothetical protein [Actinomycetota bacterium]